MHDNNGDDFDRNLSDLRHNLALIGRNLDDLDTRDRKTTRNRLSLLHIHATTAVLVGAGVVANGPGGISSPAYMVVRLVPGAPLTVGAVLLIMGVVLGVATFLRAVRVEMFAVAAMAGWYLLFATSFAVATFSWHVHPVGAQPSWQGMFAYYGWSALLIAHLVVLRWVNAVNRRGAGARR